MKTKKDIPERWYEVFGLTKNDFQYFDSDELLRIPGHVFLKF